MSIDDDHYKLIRANVMTALKAVGAMIQPYESVLEIGPDDDFTLKSIVLKGDNRITYAAIDNRRRSGSVGIADICNNQLENEYDYVVACEVLEHCEDPTKAIIEMVRLAKQWVVITVPFNFRIHGPLPDNWRITPPAIAIHLRNICKYVEIQTICSPDRPLMPICFTVWARPK